MAISKKLREQVYQKYNGRCAYCGCELAIKDMQVDHLIPNYILDNPVYLESRNNLTDIEKKALSAVTETYADEFGKERFIAIRGDHPDNLMPTCRQCNFYRQTSTLNDFRHNIEETLWHKLEKDFNYRLLTKYGCIEEHRKQITFYFEKGED